MTNLNKICRICKSELTNRILFLENMPLTDDFLPIKNNNENKEYLNNIEIFQCNNCKIVQNPDNFDISSYYKEYNYSSGHSELTKVFMNKISAYTSNKFKEIFNFRPASVIEIGSGDGVQLSYFGKNSFIDLLGVEPSEYLCEVSEKNGIKVIKSIFDRSIFDKLGGRKFDICFSSYTFDHIQNPNEYLSLSHNILNENSLLIFEIHDLNKIIDRSEWCLFEHEHTIYLNQITAEKLLNENGFELIEINPIPEEHTRANSLIIVAKKISKRLKFNIEIPLIGDLQNQIDSVKKNIDNFLEDIPSGQNIVGFGVGGRGVMTLASLNNANKFRTIFDSNYLSDTFLTPKSRIPVSSINDLSNYNDCFCLVFSFGYFDEINSLLISNGFDKNKIISLKKFYN